MLLGGAWAAIIVGLPLLICLYIYWPGLESEFLLDDIPNLQGLGERPNETLDVRISHFLTEADAGPLGRPISLLSFFMDDIYWPTDPWKFKYTNLLIHTLNGALVLALSYLLLRNIGERARRAGLIAALTATAWMLHPLQVSTVLYVIQRMAELSTLFTLAALISYLVGRSLLALRPLAGLGVMGLGMLLFGTLGMLSKENAVLLLPLILVLEFALLRPLGAGKPRYLDPFLLVFVVTPIVIVVGYFFSVIDPTASYGNRAFDMWERLLTQCVVLASYVKQIVMPNAVGSGLFHDDFPISTGLFSPPETALFLALIITTLVGALVMRRRWPLVAFAILWFFAAHLLESTVIPLELYFEHRNYLAMFGFLFAFIALSVTVSSRLRPVFLIIAGFYISTLILVTHENVKLWADPIGSSKVWAAENPSSLRAQQHAADVRLRAGDVVGALRHLDTALHYNPNQGGVYLAQTQVACQVGKLKREHMQELIERTGQLEFDNSTVVTLLKWGRVYDTLQAQCGLITPENIIQLAEGLLRNPRYQHSVPRHALNYLLGMMYAELGYLGQAMGYMDLATRIKPVIDIYFIQVNWLLSAGLFEDALDYLERAEQLDSGERHPLARDRRADEIQHMREYINALIRARQRAHEQN